MLTCLGNPFHYEAGKQTLRAAIGMHGAGGYRAQCGLVEGGLMFMGGFTAQDQPHLCEALTKKAVLFAWQFIKTECEEMA